MRKRTLRHIVGILARYHRHGVWRKIVSVMCCIVVFCTTYAMILPAITLERAPTCGKEEHTHTQECYTKVTEEAKRIPVCSLERLGVHTHTEACKDETGVICCYDATFVVHEHDGSCYENGNLICPLPEIKAHTHDDSCYESIQAETHTEKERGDLICTLPTDTAHTHTEECYTGEPVLTCQLPEEEGHRHSDACYNENQELICGQEEREGHTHNDQCYKTTPVLTCTLSEEPHQHTDECYDWIEVEVKDPPVEPVLICDKKEIILHTHTMADCYQSDEYGHNYLVCTTLQILEHVHTPDCFRTVEADPDVLTCGKEEGPDHTHTDLCYGKWVLACGKEEHTHTDECRQAPPVEFRWNRDGLEITAAFASDVELPEGAALTVERWTPETPVPLPQLLASFAAQPIADTETPVGNGTDPAAPVGNGLAHSSQEADTEPATPDGNAHSSEETETEPADAQQASLLPAEEVPPQQITSTCMDYFRVYLAVDGVEVDPQAPAEVSIRLQSDKYLDASHVELVQVTDNSVLAQADQTGSLNASFTGAVAGDYAVLAEAPRAAGSKPAASITPSKTIEALTEANTYRLHLDAVVGGSMADTPMNMLLVVDMSYSMTYSMKGKDYSGTARNVILGRLVNGGDGESGAKQDGLIYEFLSQNPQNQIAVITFTGTAHNAQGDASTVMNWTSQPKGVDLSNPQGATNYCAAFMEADEALRKITNNNPTVIVFLSDGRPTYYITESGKADGPGNEDNLDKVNDCIEKSKPFFDEYIRTKYPTVPVYTVGISTDIVGDKKDEILKYMAETSGGEYIPADTADKLGEAIESIKPGKTYTALKIEDKLSTYVDLADDPQYRVTKKSADGTEVTLWEGTSATANGTNIIQSVAYDTNTKNVTATFVPSYELEPGCTYSLSYNVKVSQAAKDAYAADNTYAGTIGDPNTDYDPTKATSSGQPGFRSNDVATMSYKADGKDGSKTYPHPVVQVSGPTAQPELDLTPHKTIDAFWDGVDNPDTDLDTTAASTTDLYRLYLDAEVKQQLTPIDLLLVVDQSGSMHDNYSGAKGNDMKDFENKDIYRDDAVNLVLNGTSDTSADADIGNGLISQFLKANPENRLALVTFEGHAENANSDYGTEAPYDYDSNTDADTVFAEVWTNTPQKVTIEGLKYNATNYTAAILEADRVLAQSTTNHKKVMVFVSDGLPTAFINKDENGNYYRDGNGQNEGKRPGGWFTPGGTISTGDATTNAFSDFVKKYPNLLIHTVSIRATNATARLESMKSPEVGHCYSVSTTDELRKALSKLMYGTAYAEMIIEDTLSAEVDLYEDQPDYKVTLTDPTGKVTVLYEGGEIKPAGIGIMESVSYDKASKKVTAKFNPSYTPAPGCKVTLSFNVKTNQAAYEKFKSYGYGDVVGDSETDYGTNGTSSSQPGFYSNDYEKTKVTYLRYNEAQPESEHYPKPVVQVNAEQDHPFAVKKQWLSYDGKDITATQSDVPSVEFKLFQNASGKITTTPDEVPVTVNGKADGYPSSQLRTTQAAVGSEATLQFNIGSSNFKYLVAGDKTVPSSEIEVSGRTYTYIFKVPSGGITITIYYSNAWSSPSNVSLTCSPAPPTSQDWSDTKELLNAGGGTWREKTSENDVGEKWILSKANNWEVPVKDLPTKGTVSDGKGGTIDVTYSYTVEEVPVDGYTTNVLYGTNYTGDVVKGIITVQNQSTTQTYKIIVQKVSSEDNTQMLSGAKFDIYRKAQGGEKLGDLEGTYIKLDLGNDLIATGDNGQMEFDGLAPGDYCLVETKAPSGYHTYVTPIPFSIGTDGKVTSSDNGVAVSNVGTVPTITVPNKPWGHELPSTGGTGREPYTIGGLLVITLAVLLLYNKKRGKEDAISS